MTGTDLAVAPHLVAHDAQALDLDLREVELTAHLRRLLAATTRPSRRPTARRTSPR